MTVFREKAAGSVARDRTRYSVGSYIAVGLAAVALGAGVVWASVSIAGSDAGPIPAEIAEIRAEQYVDQLESAWLARINSARAEAQVEMLAAQHAARLATINEQRAADMVEHEALRFSAELARINEQRAADMVEFQRGGSN